MAPMTRNRAIDNLPNDLMAEYYGQRAGAGLIITEGTAPDANGLGYARIPGIYSEAQVAGWRKTTQAVHERGGLIFVQLMHTGRVSHPANMEAGTTILAPSAVAAAGEIYTDALGNQPHPEPKAMTEADLMATRDGFVRAAQNARTAGFDGVELHAANGYLLEQFLHPHTNRRTDAYGGSLENRARFVLEVAEAVAAAIGADRVGIRLSPYGVFNDLPPYDGVDEAYAWLAAQLDARGLAYIHLVDHSSMGAPAVAPTVVREIRKAFGRTLILSGGYDLARAEADLGAGNADLIAFGRPFLANPDLVERFKAGAELNAPDYTTLYTPGEKGYTDYPVLDSHTA
jgi:N-ethylmaleimide reductase